RGWSRNDLKVWSAWNGVKTYTSPRWLYDPHMGAMCLCLVNRNVLHLKQSALLMSYKFHRVEVVVKIVEKAIIVVGSLCADTSSRQRFGLRNLNSNPALRGLGGWLTAAIFQRDHFAW